MRTHYCGHVNEQLVGQEVTVCGWVNHRRDHGGVIFIDLRDREGVLQVVIDPDTPAAFALAERARSECVLRATGKVRPRPTGTVNSNLATGKMLLVRLSAGSLRQPLDKPSPTRRGRAEQEDWSGATSAARETHTIVRRAQLDALAP